MNAWVTCERDFVAFASAGAEALKIMWECFMKPKSKISQELYQKLLDRGYQERLAKI